VDQGQSETGQGDEDGGPKIVTVADQGFDATAASALPRMTETGVLSFSKPSGYAQVARVESRPVPNPTESSRARREESGRFLVQVGAFKRQSDAKSQLSKISRSFSSHFDDAQGVVGGKVDGFFRAQFKGFSEDAARNACSALKAKRLACMVIAP